MKHSILCYCNFKLCNILLKLFIDLISLSLRFLQVIIYLLLLPNNMLEVITLFSEYIILLYFRKGMIFSFRQIVDKFL